MKKEYILVIDSGLGGINILKSLKENLKTENFIYVLDNKNCPFGDKSKEFLVQNTIKLIDYYMHRYCIKLIVFACNTLTSATICDIRQFLCEKRSEANFNLKCNNKKNNKTINYNIPVVGTEPPIKMVNTNEKTLILATKLTLKYNKIINENLDEKNFTFVALKDIAKLVDEDFYDRSKIYYSLKQQIPQKKYQNVVLGCTHYYYLENLIKMVLQNPHLKFFTATEGVTKQVKRLLEQNQNSNLKKGRIIIKLTKFNPKLAKTAKSILKN